MPLLDQILGITLCVGVVYLFGMAFFFLLFSIVVLSIESEEGTGTRLVAAGILAVLWPWSLTEVTEFYREWKSQNRFRNSSRPISHERGKEKGHREASEDNQN